MAALPYMRIYWADYDADTAHLTTMQHGIYLLLIKNYWQRGAALPDDETKLARIAKVSIKDWRHNADVIREFFSIQENLWTHKRIAEELSRVEAKSLKAKDAALANAKRTQSKRTTNAERPLIYTEAEAHTVPLDKSNGADADQILWESAKLFLKPERADPGSLIGRWCRDFGKEATAQALTKAQLERPAQRIPFVEACLKKHKQEQDNASSWDFMP